MVGPQQTTGLIGQKWKTGNGLELTGTNRPTQTTTPPHTTHTACVGSPGVSTSKHAQGVHYTVHTQPNHQPHTQHTHACVGVGRQPDNRITGTLTHCPCSRLGGHSDRETPGPIPNPEAKPDSADGTAPARVRESRTPPSTHHTFGPRGAPQGAPPGAEPVAALKTTPPRRNPSRGRIVPACTRNHPQHPQPDGTLLHLRPRGARTELTAGYETVHHCLCDS